MFKNQVKIGLQGPPGLPGPPGKDGKTIKGSKGDPGINGINGINGKDGINGISIQGPTGPKGDKGDNGVNGKDGQYGGPTGPTGINGKDGENGYNGYDGKLGPTGPTGQEGKPGKDIIIYNDLSIYSIKIMHNYNKINQNTNILMYDNWDSVDVGALNIRMLTNSSKYIKNITLSKNNYILSFYIVGSEPIKCLHMSNMGQLKSVPICMTNVEVVDEYSMIVYFNFDSQVSYDEYVYYGSIYDIYVNWF